VRLVGRCAGDDDDDDGLDWGWVRAGLIWFD
jgi:hypothetical protein